MFNLSAFLRLIQVWLDFQGFNIFLESLNHPVETIKHFLQVLTAIFAQLYFIACRKAALCVKLTAAFGGLF